jgi:phosphomannomutase
VKSAPYWCRYRLKEIQALAESGNLMKSRKRLNQKYNILPEFIEHLMGYIDPAKIRPLKLVVNAGNGAAGHVIDAIEEKFKALNIPVEFIKIHHEANGHFPNGIPNPILVENRDSTAMQCLNITQIWVLLGMVTSTAVSCLMKKANSLKVIILLVF